MSFSLYQANVQHGVYTSGAENHAGQIAILTSGVDLVCVQERSTGDTGWDASMSTAGFSEVVYRENGHGNDGPAIWRKNSRVTVNSVHDHALSTGAIGWDGTTNVDKAAVGANLTVDGGAFYLFCTHLAWSRGADAEGSPYSSIRVAQINELNSWISGIVGSNLNVVIAGDMNFGPDYPKNPSGLQIDLFTADYSDLWVQGISEGKATAVWDDRDSSGSPDMPITSLTTRTHDTRRIDYVFLRQGAALRLDAIDLPDLRSTCSGALTGSPAFCPDTAADQRTGTPDDFGVRPSDHNWFTVTLSHTSVPRVRGKVKMSVR